MESPLLLTAPAVPGSGLPAEEHQTRADGELVCVRPSEYTKEPQGSHLCMHCAVVDESKDSQRGLLLLLDRSGTSCSASADLEVQKQSAALTMTSPAGLLQQVSPTVAGTWSKGETRL